MGQSCSNICTFHKRKSSADLTLASAADFTPVKRTPETPITTTTYTDEDSVVKSEIFASPFLGEDKEPHLEMRVFKQFRVKESEAVAETQLRRLIAACRENNTDKARELIRLTPDVNCTSLGSPLLLAIRRKNIEIVAALIEAGASLSPYYSGIGGRTISPVLEAARTGDVDVLRLLYQSGGDITLTVVPVTQDGETIADVADPHNEDMQEFLEEVFAVEMGKVSLNAETAPGVLCAQRLG